MESNDMTGSVEFRLKALGWMEDWLPFVHKDMVWLKPAFEFKTVEKGGKRVESGKFAGYNGVYRDSVKSVHGISMRKKANRVGRKKM